MRGSASSKLMDSFMRGDPDAIENMKIAASEKQAALSKKDEEDSFKITTLLNDDHSSASKVYDFLNRALGEDWYEWEIETIERELFIKCGAALEDVNRDKVLAIRHVCRSDGCFFDWFEFNQIALSFSGCVAGFDALRSPTPGAVINAIKAINHIRPDRNGEFGNDVKKYICILFINNGLYTCPPSLNGIICETMKTFVSDETKKMNGDIINRYKTVLTNPETILDESAVDIQVRRLLKSEAAALEYAQ